MPRSYRTVILATFGCVILGAAPAPDIGARSQQDQANSNLQRSLDSIAAAENRIAEPGQYQQPCPDGKDDNRSDLCAQWHAALAASEAARWSFWSMFLAFCSVGTSVVGIVLIWRTLLNDHIAKRPYVFLFRTIKKRHDWTNEMVKIEGVNFRNVGETFAYVRALIVCSDFRDTPPDPKAAKLEKYPPSAAIIPKEDWPLKNAISVRLPDPDWRPTTAGPPLFAYGQMIYEDAYGRFYHLWFCRVYNEGTFGFEPDSFGDLEKPSFNGTVQLRRTNAERLIRDAADRTSGTAKGDPAEQIEHIRGLRGKS
jgi:hypothetical protein